MSLIGSRCCVADCSWAQLTPYRALYSMPTETVRCEQWIDLLDITNVTKPMSTYRICDLHFVDDDFDKNEDGLRLLKETAVPSLKLPKIRRAHNREYKLKRKFDMPGVKVVKKEIINLVNYPQKESSTANTAGEIKKVTKMPGVKVVMKEKFDLVNYPQKESPIANTAGEIKKVTKMPGVKVVMKEKFDLVNYPQKESPIANYVGEIKKVIKRQFVLKSSLPYNPNKEDPLFQIYPESEEPPVGILNVSGNGESNSSLVSYSDLDVKVKPTDKNKVELVVKDEEWFGCMHGLEDN